MIDFSISRRSDKVTPTFVRSTDGQDIPVDADFRTVLKCFRILRERDLTEAKKLILLNHYFFKGQMIPESLELFCCFLGNEERSDPSDPVMDFEQDADAIYASFMQVYGIDLIDVPFLHWNKFKVLLSGLGADCALGRRIQLRNLDVSKFPSKERAELERAKRSVQLNTLQMTAEEERLQKALDEALASGKDPTDEVRALNDYYDRIGGENNG